MISPGLRIVMSNSEGPFRSTDAGGGPTRRDVLKRVGVAGAALTLSAGARPVRAMGTVDGEDGSALATAPLDDPDLPGIHLEPVVGDCRDVFAHSTECGFTSLYGETPNDELGSHTFELTFEGVPFSAFEGDFDPGFWATRGGVKFDRIPKPPSADPTYGPYEILVYGSDLEFGAVHDLLALDWYATCDVTPECRDSWCRVFDQTLTDLRNSVKDARAAIDLANARLSAEVFTATVPTQASESAIVAALEVEITTAVMLAARQVYDDHARLKRERLAAERASGDREIIDEGALCGACSNCDPLYPPFDRVEAWELRVFEEGDATAEWTSHESPAEGWAKYGLRASLVLERVDPFGDLLPEFDGFVGAVLSFLLGILSFLADLLGEGSGGQYLWSGTSYEAAAWKDAGWRIIGDDGSEIVSTGRGQHHGSGVLDPGVDFMIDTRTDEYTLTFPSVEVEGVSTYVTPDRVGTGEYLGWVGFGDLVSIKATGGNVPGFEDIDDPSVDVYEYEEVRWPLETDDEACSLRISNELEVSLDGEGIDPLVMVTYNGPEGTAKLRWELVPLRLADDVPARRVGCP